MREEYRREPERGREEDFLPGMAQTGPQEKGPGVLGRNPIRRPGKGLTGSALKMIAMISMLIDHIGAVILEPALWGGGGDPGQVMFWGFRHETWWTVYMAMRSIGRIAFPLFCFLLVEGFLNTRDVRRYAVRILAFALISEVPFDLAFNGFLLELTYQNVFWTLLFGLLGIWGFEKLSSSFTGWAKGTGVIGGLVCIGAAMAAAHFARTDYGWFGVALIAILYLLRSRPLLRGIGASAALCLWTVWEAPAILAFVPIWLYNGKRGMGLKYLFYCFYPAHLLALYWIWRLAQGIP